MSGGETSERELVGSAAAPTLDSDMLIVGAGAKAAAIAAKVHALNTLGLAWLKLTIVEASEPAASWSGRNGMTSGEEPLAITPIKDVGFPYESFEQFAEEGHEIDRLLMALSWQQYLIEQGGYARWVNAGSPTIRHRDYGRYLAWVLSRATAGVTLVRGHVTKIALCERTSRWLVEIAGAPRHRCAALTLTGPGVHRRLEHDPACAARVFHCDSRRSELAQIPADREVEIAIAGGGESALSCLAFLRAFRPRAQLTVYTPTLPLSRGESFLENRVFSNPDEVAWSSLDIHLRRDFVKHCDRGVFDVQSLATFAYDDHCQFITARVKRLEAAEDGDGVIVERLAPDGGGSMRFDYFVNCTGFDLLEQLRSLFAPDTRADIEGRVGPLWERASHVDVPIGRFLELEGMRPRLHIPGLAGLSQGPGFANLGCLGLLANRVLQPFLLDREVSQPDVASSAAHDRDAVVAR